MRQLPRLYSLIAILVGAATLSLVGVGESSAAMRSFSMMRGPAINKTMIAPRKFVAPNKLLVPRLSKLPKTNLMVRTPKNPDKYPNRTTVDTKNPNRPVAGNPPGRNPDGPGRPGPTGPRPGPGVIIGTGVAIGPGVIIGTPGPAGAVPPGAFGPPGAFNPPGGPQGPGGPRNGIHVPPANENRFVKNEVVLEFAGNRSPAAIAQLLARHRLVQIERASFALTNTTYLRVRIPDQRPVRSVLRALGGEVTLRSGQANFYFTHSQANAVDTLPQLQPPPGAATQLETKHPAKPPTGAEPLPALQAPGFVTSSDVTPQPTPVAAAAAALPAKGDAAQYALAKLNLEEAHRLALGSNVLVAVIDSGVDVVHPELAGVIVDSYDALGSGEKPHKHGTAIAGAIAAHSRLLGVAPAARILAIRAFGTKGASADATTFAILKSLEYAVDHGARIINMSFSGPFDPGLGRHLAAAYAKGAVLIAASGNLGAKSPPQYPAADANVIAVTATDADDRLFVAANRGDHVAVAAPGVDILLPAPDNDYWMASGTSFAAAHVSGIAALILSRRPDLAPDQVKQILMTTARDLGPPGRDPQFGAGLADAHRAVMAVGLGTVAAPTPLPVTAGR